MSMKTGQSVSGFIASDPTLTYGPNGVARFYARMGIEHYRHEDDGSFTQLEPSFHNLVLFRKTAERAADMFANGYVNLKWPRGDGLIWPKAESGRARLEVR